MKTYFLISVPFSNVGSGGTDCTTFALVESVKPPLSAIVTGATLLATSEHLDDGTVRIASRMLNSANRTSRMIDDLLDLTRTRFAEPTPVVREPMDLDPLCRQVVAEVEELRSAGALEYTSTGGIHGEWDHDPVAQLFSNLVRNAIQQGAETDAIKITATGHTEEVVLSVHNTGTAIPRRVMIAIFEPMMRVTDAPHNAGLGLGLYIASQVALAHGGTLDAKSTEAAGATFTAHLPRR